MKSHRKKSQSEMTPESSLQALKDGNVRFINASQIARDLNAQVDATSSGQFPFATVLHCIDSRVSAEHIFDQGIGDLFSIRIAGNFVNDDILGSMEFACKLAGTKVLVVLGHTACGAVDAVSLPEDESMRNSSNISFVNSVAAKNVEMTLIDIREKSEILKEMEAKGELMIIGGMYDISNGKVTFYA